MQQEDDDDASGEEDQQGGPAYLEVLVQEVEEQQDGDQEGQGKGRRHPNQNDGGRQLQATAQEEGRKVRQVLVHIRCVLSQPVDDSACWGHVEEGEGRPAQQKKACVRKH